MSKQLSDECIKAIEKESNKQYGSINTASKIVYGFGAKVALTNPEIYTKADLIHSSDFTDFIYWAENESGYVMISKIGWCLFEPIDTRTNPLISTSELYTLYINQK